MDMAINGKPGLGKKLSIVGVPLGFGAGKRGSELGAEAIRMSQIRGRSLVEHLEELGYEVADLGDVEIIKPVSEAKQEENPKYLSEMAASCRNMLEPISHAIDGDTTPVILGGDHSIAVGTFSALASKLREDEGELGLIWFDAHADINTPETSSSGNIHGMPLAALLGHGTPELVELGGFSPKLNPQYLAHIGARDVDPGEKETIHKLGLRDNFFTMSDIDRFGMQECVQRAIDIAGKAPAGFAVTFDVDMIDPRFAPGSGTLVRGGTTYREAHLALEAIAETGGMRSFEIVEVNPLIDENNITVELACELILSAFGKTIL